MQGKREKCDYTKKLILDASPVLSLIAHSVWCSGQGHKWGEWAFACENVPRKESKVSQAHTWDASIITRSPLKIKANTTPCHPLSLSPSVILKIPITNTTEALWLQTFICQCLIPCRCEWLMCCWMMPALLWFQSPWYDTPIGWRATLQWW